MGIQYLTLTMEQMTKEVGNELLGRTNKTIAINTAQIQMIDQWTTTIKNAHSALNLQLEANKRSGENLVMELETVKKDQARKGAESIARHEMQQKALQLAIEKYKNFLPLTNANMSRVSKTCKGME